MEHSTYIAIDLKSFYASVECVSRGLDPMTTHLVVADPSRTEKTICLAVSPSLKAYGIPGRARLFEVVERVREINAQRKQNAPGHRLEGSSFDATALKDDPRLKLDYLVAPPRMADYIRRSTQIYSIYLRYVAPEDIHVYSIDEVFIDATHYLKTYGLTGRALAKKMILDVLSATGITAAAGVGTNLYLCKVAMDIWAKHIPADSDGVRIAELTEQSYRENLWTHRPLTDFWRIGPGYAKKLESHGLYTMGDVARCSLGKPGDFHNEDLLYRLFGVNAELLIDHAWGWEPCTIAQIKAYRPASNSAGAGQVLQYAYPFNLARLVLHEMADQLALDLVEKNLVTDQLVIAVGYDVENLKDPQRLRAYRGPVVADHYGRAVPKSAHGSVNLDGFTSSSRQIVAAAVELFDRIANPDLLVRRLNIVANHLTAESVLEKAACVEQMDFFTDYAALQKERDAQNAQRMREKSLQQAAIAIKKRYGKNALIKGTNLEEGATAMMRNRQIGGHKA